MQSLRQDLLCGTALPRLFADFTDRTVKPAGTVEGQR